MIVIDHIGFCKAIITILVTIQVLQCLFFIKQRWDEFTVSGIVFMSWAQARCHSIFGCVLRGLFATQKTCPNFAYGRFR